MRSGVFIGLAAIISAVAGALAFSLLASGNDPTLTIVAGALAMCDDEGFCIEGTALDFGDRSMLSETASRIDHDGDGVLGSRLDELTGLLGSLVVVEVGSGWGTVYTLNGYPWRDLGDPFVAAPSTTTSTTETTSTASTSPPTTIESPVTTQANPPQTTTTTRPTEPTQPTQPPTGEVRGTLEKCGSAYCVDDQSLYFGPFWYMVSGTSAPDLNENGEVDPPVDELDFLLGSEVSIDLLFEDDNQVWRINGVEWRSRTGAPPWAGGPGIDDED